MLYNMPFVLSYYLEKIQSQKKKRIRFCQSASKVSLSYLDSEYHLNSLIGQVYSWWFFFGRILHLMTYDYSTISNKQ